MALMEHERIGEVVEASTEGFTVQCHHLYGAPALGSLVRTRTENRAYAIVCRVTTQGVDPSRRPTARGQNLETESEIYQENPQLAHLLKTEFYALTVGHDQADGPRTYLPGSPPTIHAFVYSCSPEEIRAFTQDLDFLDLLVSSPNVSDEAIAACLRLASSCYPETEEFLVRAGKHITMLLHTNSQRLGTVLRRLVS